MTELTLTRAEYARRINQRVSESVEAVLDIGRLLVQAKADLPHGEFEAMVRDDLPFSRNTAHRLRQIATDPRISNVAHVPHLPPHWGTLYELTKLDDGAWEQALDAGIIRPDMQRKDIIELRRVEREQEQAETPTLSTEHLDRLIEQGYRFGTVYADPPWVYSNQGTRAATSNHYDGMTVDELCELPVHDLAADDAFLHLWTTNAFLFDCQRIMEAWGFEYRSCYVWVKPQMGIGNYWRVSHEFMLLGRRGSPKWADRGMKSWGQFDRTKHSAKPEEIRRLIERACPGPYIELFGRRPVEGWVVWGNEIEVGLFDRAVSNVA